MWKEFISYGFIIVPRLIGNHTLQLYISLPRLMLTLPLPRRFPSMPLVCLQLTVGRRRSTLLQQLFLPETDGCEGRRQHLGLRHEPLQCQQPPHAAIPIASTTRVTGTRL